MANANPIDWSSDYTTKESVVKFFDKFYVRFEASTSNPNIGVLKTAVNMLDEAFCDATTKNTKNV